MQIGFLNEIAGKLSGEYDVRLTDKCVLFGGKAVYVEGHSGIEGYSPAEISLRLNKATLKIIGENLKIAELSKEDILVKGKIKSVAREEK